MQVIILLLVGFLARIATPVSVVISARKNGGFCHPIWLSVVGIISIYYDTTPTIIAWRKRPALEDF